MFRLEPSMLLLIGSVIAVGCQQARSGDVQHADDCAATHAPPPSVASADPDAKPHSSAPPAPESPDEAEGCEPLAPRNELLDPNQELVERGASGWNYVERLHEDLDGDGTEETLWVLARAEMADGEPVWDDGQPWQVYVEEASGETTHLLARYVQLARLEVALARGETPELLFDASGPSTAVLYRVRYQGPGRFLARKVLEESNVMLPQPVRRTAR